MNSRAVTPNFNWGRRGLDCMVDRSNTVSSNLAQVRCTRYNIV